MKQKFYYYEMGIHFDNLITS